MAVTAAARPDARIRDVCGVPVHALTMDDVLSLVDDAVAHRDPLRIGVVNAAKIVNMRRDVALRAAVVSCDVVVADGMSVVWASRLLARPVPERITGIDLMLGMLRRGDDRGYRVYCLGATDAVLDRAVARIAADFPGVVVAGRHHGYFEPGEAERVAEAIAAARPDILLVAMTSPKKEEFLARWADAIGAPVCHGVGGSFEVLAGTVRRAPMRWQRLGLEWLYRVAQEPRRLWRRYLITNTLFCGLVVGALARRALGPVLRAPRARTSG